MEHDDILLDVRNLSVEYASPGQEPVQAVHDVSFTLRRGEF
ncbi:peptide ABC transporter ATP-binding protein, partial [Salmonella enterica subsp. enterica serovar Haifa]|nr:peptide ABC transporter ATP-binding protein [Salmonella enterica subsp. enterica serovar Haifa]